MVFQVTVALVKLFKLLTLNTQECALQSCNCCVPASLKHTGDTLHRLNQAALQACNFKAAAAAAARHWRKTHESQHALQRCTTMQQGGRILQQQRRRAAYRQHE